MILLSKLKMGIKMRYIFIVFILIGCSNALDDSLTSENLSEITKLVESSSDYGAEEKLFIKDSLVDFVTAGALSEVFGVSNSELQNRSARQLIDELTLEYQDMRQNYEHFTQLIKINDAMTTSTSRQQADLWLKLQLNNPFDKDILYVDLDYTYIDKYDNHFFSYQTKITDEISSNFSEEVSIRISHQFDDFTDFAWTEVPTRASNALADEIGREEADQKVQRDYLLKGLKLTPTKIVFKDRSEVVWNESIASYIGLK